MDFFVETLVGGLLAGTMYALVAIGFVLIYKASRVFNFAQGSILLLATLAFVTLHEDGVPFWAAGILSLGIIVVLSIVIEWAVLRPLTNRSDLTLFMATLGLSYVIEGVAQAVMGTDVHALDLGIADVPINLGPIQLSQFDLFAAGVAVLLVIALSLIFNRTHLGISLRAVADNQLAAQSVGIRLDRIWRIVWTVAGFIGLVAGLLWGAREGVQFSLSLIVLKALPILVIGGFDSIIGAILGGLIVGAGENLAELYLGPLIGGGISSWFAYVLALGFLLVRPAGMFGERAIERI
jgi:branched-chain amino acid transport system permease protein